MGNTDALKEQLAECATKQDFEGAFRLVRENQAEFARFATPAAPTPGISIWERLPQWAISESSAKMPPSVEMSVHWRPHVLFPLPRGECGMTCAGSVSSKLSS